MRVDDIRYWDFQKGNGRGNCGHGQQHEKCSAKQLSARQFGKQPRQYDKDQSRSAGAGVEARDRESGGKYDESGQQRHAGVEQHHPPGCSDEAYLPV